MNEHPFDHATPTTSHLWTSAAFIPVFAATSRIHIRAGAGGPMPWQREVYDRFLAIQDVLRPRLQQALLAHYLDVVDEYRAMFAPDFLDRAPIISTFRELASLLEPETLVVYDDLRPVGEVGLLYGCTWDPGHGVGVRVGGSEVLAVGPQDICL